jgi:hypothetical protein
VNSGPAGASDITPKIPVSKPYQLSDAIAVPSVPPVTIAGQIMPSMGDLPADLQEAIQMGSVVPPLVLPVYVLPVEPPGLH